MGSIGGCGAAEEPPPEDPNPSAPRAAVIAAPEGGNFARTVRVELIDPEGGEVFFTTDGTSASDSSAQPYSGPIELAATTLLQFTSRHADGSWAPTGRELYTQDPIAPLSGAMLRRGRPIPGDILFFAWRPGDPVPMEQEFRILSFGRESLQIQSIGMRPNPAGGFFYNPNVFSFATESLPRLIRPGEDLVIKVRYQPTETLHSVVLRVESDAENGPIDVEVWGRVSPW